MNFEVASRGHLLSSRSPRPHTPQCASPLVCIIESDSMVRDALPYTLDAQDWELKAFASVEAFVSQSPFPGQTCLVLDLSIAMSGVASAQKCFSAAWTSISLVLVTDYGQVIMTLGTPKEGGGY